MTLYSQSQHQQRDHYSTANLTVISQQILVQTPVSHSVTTALQKSEKNKYWRNQKFYLNKNEILCNKIFTLQFCFSRILRLLRNQTLSVQLTQVHYWFLTFGWNILLETVIPEMMRTQEWCYYYEDVSHTENELWLAGERNLYLFQRQRMHNTRDRRAGAITS